MLHRLTTQGKDGVVRRAIRTVKGIARTMLNSAACRSECCDCWRPTTPCASPVELPPECQGSGPPEVVISCAAVCKSTGQPVQPGQVFKHGQHCYTVNNSTIPSDDIPAQAIVIQPGAQVQCAAHCFDLACPTNVLWVEGQACDEVGANVIPPWIPVCLIDECFVGHAKSETLTQYPDWAGICWKFDPDAAQNAVPLRPAVPGDFDRHRSCCSCLIARSRCVGEPTLVNPCDFDGSETEECCCGDEPDNMLRYTVEFSSSLTRHEIQRANAAQGGGSSETDETITLTLIAPDPVSPQFLLAKYVRTITTVYRDSQGNVTLVDGPFVQEFEDYLLIGPCPHYEITSTQPAFAYGFGYFVFSDDEFEFYDAFHPCSFTKTLDGGSQTVTTEWRRNCEGSTYTSTGTLSINFPPHFPGDGSLEREITTTRNWSVSFLPEPGPCTNGCGDGSSAVKGGVLASRVGARTTRDLGSGLGGFL